ncbi:dihydroxyacetone kinase subunit L [Oceanobacillus piezotolerans]|uniref:phosphoenolpyruvate--glycerone phosphotransferase n=1 Tax=Oceanobacillus piezotolerans TaxID=2448030 RepID=A0A498DPZ1_9BACI|nr:dihydroxyacetone kinase subunit DhaL [Oceanobacillus piezotolerans]RLL46629.1 dihydroxyacetone kinase subunit L [Oceanobacillus piezotolerans]
MELTIEDTIKWMQLTNDKIQKNKEHLTALDQVIGDSDHGINMARGFQEVMKKLDAATYETVSDVMKDVAMTLMSKVGGAAGPLYGTAFLKLSMSLKDSQKVDESSFAKALEEAVQGIIMRGKANAGEKTMLDVWIPVQDYFSANNVKADELETIAKTAMEQTKELKATKGRASYFKDKSIGHIDPGSASSYYLFTSLAEVIE